MSSIGSRVHTCRPLWILLASFVLAAAPACTESAPRGTFGPGTALEVPEGVRRVGPVFERIPAEDIDWMAILVVDKDPLHAWDDLVAQAREKGFPLLGAGVVKGSAAVCFWEQDNRRVDDPGQTPVTRPVPPRPVGVRCDTHGTSRRGRTISMYLTWSKLSFSHHITIVGSTRSEGTSVPRQPEGVTDPLPATPTFDWEAYKPQADDSPGPGEPIGVDRDFVVPEGARGLDHYAQLRWLHGYHLVAVLEAAEPRQALLDLLKQRMLPDAQPPAVTAVETVDTTKGEVLRLHMRPVARCTGWASPEDKWVLVACPMAGPR